MRAIAGYRLNRYDWAARKRFVNALCGHQLTHPAPVLPQHRRDCSDSPPRSPQSTKSGGVEDWRAGGRVRLYFASFAYVLMQALRRLGLAGTELARAQCGTIREKVLNVGALIRISVRKVWLSMPESYPRAGLLRTILRVWRRFHCAVSA